MHKNTWSVPAGLTKCFQAAHTPKPSKSGLGGICCRRKNRKGRIPVHSHLSSTKKKALSGDLDFLRKRKPTVPMYADGLRLLVFDFLKQRMTEHRQPLNCSFLLFCLALLASRQQGCVFRTQKGCRGSAPLCLGVCQRVRGAPWATNCRGTGGSCRSGPYFSRIQWRTPERSGPPGYRTSPAPGHCPPGSRRRS